MADTIHSPDPASQHTPVSSNKRIYTAGGPVQSGGGIYIERRADRVILDLCRASEFAYVLTTRQVGKSSLMFRAARQFKAEGALSVIVDLSRIGTEVTSEQWYLTLLNRITNTLLPGFDVFEWWNSLPHFGHVERMTRFFEDVLLARVTERIVVFIDEIDTTLSLQFADDFFAAIRVLYNDRAQASELRRLSFVLIGVANPNDLISDPKRTPFNIGHAVELTDFTFDEALPLAEGFSLPKDEARKLLGWTLKWTGGHPFLTQHLCRAVANQDRDGWTESEFDHLVNETFFGAEADKVSNLRAVRDLLTKRAPAGYKDDVLKIYRQVLQGRVVPDEERSVAKSHLKLAGVIQRDDEGALQVRNPIYRRVFDEKWIAEHRSVNWAKRLVYVAAGLIATIVIFLLPISLYALKQANAAENQAKIAQSRGLTAYAMALPEFDLEVSFQLAAKAVSISPTEQAIDALRTLLPNTFLHVELRGHSESVNTAAFSPDGKRIITASGNRWSESKDNTARVWETATGRPISQFDGRPEFVTTAAISPDGKWVVTGSGEGTARVWEAATGRQISQFGGRSESVNTAAFSPDGKWIVTGSGEGTARVWEAATGRQISQFGGRSESVNTAAFSPDGKWTVTRCRNTSEKVIPNSSKSEDYTVRIWETATGRQIAQLTGHSDSVSDAAFSPDGKWVVTASYDRTTRVWEAATGRQISQFNGHSVHVFSAVFSPDSKWIVSSGYYGPVCVWEAATGRQISQFNEHSALVNTAAFSPDGKWIVTVSGDRVSEREDNTSRVWEAATGRQISQLSGHSAPVLYAAFSPDGKWVVTASEDRTARVYPYESFAPQEEILKVARMRVLRKFTEEERRRFGVE